MLYLGGGDQLCIAAIALPESNSLLLLFAATDLCPVTSKTNRHKPPPPLPGNVLLWRLERFFLLCKIGCGFGLFREILFHSHDLTGKTAEKATRHAGIIPRTEWLK